MPFGRWKTNFQDYLMQMTHICKWQIKRSILCFIIYWILLCNKVYIRYKISHNISIKASTAAKNNNNNNICICCLWECFRSLIDKLCRSDCSWCRRVWSGSTWLACMLICRCGIMCLLHMRIQEFSPRGGGRGRWGGPGRKKLHYLEKKLWQIIFLFLVLISNF